MNWGDLKEGDAIVRQRGEACYVVLGPVTVRPIQSGVGVVTDLLVLALLGRRAGQLLHLTASNELDKAYDVYPAEGA